MPHKEEVEEPAEEFTPELYPPFPDDIPTLDIPTITLSKLLEDDAAEQDRVFSACVGRGFFYLELGGCEAGSTILSGAEQIARLGSRVFQLPLAEKMRYKQAHKQLFGYKFAGSSVTDKAGTPDTAEFFNVAKNDMIVPDAEMRRPWPAEVLESKDLFAAYVRSAHAVGLKVLAVLAEKMGVDPGEFAARHRIEEPSGDHVRITRGPPRAVKEMPEVQTPSHTDSGS